MSQTTTLIIARHGNTFEPDETPRRIGARTNIPLVEKGREQARAIGLHLKESGLLPDMVYCGRLERTMQTAYLAMKGAGITRAPTPLPMFDEIDYGPDENRPEKDVIARLGEDAITAWDEKAAIPEGWRANPDEIIENWQDFGASMANNFAGKTVLAVTSNGIARFAPHVTGDFDSFAAGHKIKLSTGALAILQHNGEAWVIKDWNIKPDL